MPSADTRISRLLLCSTDTGKLAPLVERLNGAGVEVECALKADEARQQLWSQHFDGVAVDLLLADRDGISFAMELREEHPWVPLLVISTTAANKRHDNGPDWLSKTADHARLVFALKQAGQRSAGRPPSILHVENDDSVAELVQNTIGKQTRLFRARSAHEARIAMALRNYDLALARTQVSALSDQWKITPADAPQTVCVDTGADPVLTLLDNLRRHTYVHAPAYCQ